MKLRKRSAKCKGIRISAILQGQEAGRIYLYVLRNDLHEEPFGLVEDLLVSKEHRGKGIVRWLMKKMIAEARRHNCYKLVFSSRFGRDRLHNFHERLGFERSGFAFRMNLRNEPGARRDSCTR